MNTLLLENLVFRHAAKTIGRLNTGMRAGITSQLMTINYFYYSPLAVRYGAAFATFSNIVARMHINKIVLELCAARRNRPLW